MYKDQPQVDYKHKEQLLLCWFGQEGQGGQVGLDVLWVLCLWSQQQEQEQHHEFPASRLTPVYGCKPVKNYAEFFFREWAPLLTSWNKSNKRQICSFT